jgi:hypothetical protein
VHGDLESCNSVGAGYVADATQPNGAPLVCGMDYTCTGLVPENDDCANALPISVGNNVLSTFCTTQDGYNPVIFNAFGDTGESGGIVADQWFEFIPAQDCTLRVDMCATGSEYDSAIAVYSTGTPACNCPLDQATHGATFQLAADEACTFGEAVGGAGYIELPVTAGDCVLIRIGARQGANSLGLGLVDVSCGGPVCGDNAVNQPNEECDGIDDTLCPDGCRQDCTCSPPCVCGDGVAEAGCQEECDGADNAACHGHGCNPLSCTCNNVCGDNFRESAEECDGPADTSCGGAAGRCNPNCTCPPVVCGNNFKDPDEECDGSDASLCVDGVCRSPGDPAGACTCTCGLLPPPPPQPMPNPVGTCSGNGVICDVPSNNCPAGQTCIPWIAARAISFVVPPVAFPAAFRATGGPEDTAFRVTLDEVHHIGRCGTCQPIGGNPCDSNADCTSPNLCLQTAGASCNVASQCGPGGACMTAPRSGRCINGLACNLHSECPAGVCDLDPLQVPDFSAFEDSVWYVKPISSLALCCRPVSPANGEFECDPAMACVDGSDCLGAFDECVQNLCLDYAGDDTYYVCGELVCDPWFQDWSSHATGLHTVFVSGDAIVPRSTYTIEHVNKANESAGPITLESALWADINNNGAMNAIDVAEVVDKVKNTTGAVPEPYALLRKANPATANVSAEDIGFAANANKGFRYPFTIACP